MVRFLELLFALEVLLLILALISCLAAEKGDLRALPRAVWLVLILLVPVVGAIVYFGYGRPVTAQPHTVTWRPGGAVTEGIRPTKSVAPDDDPDFLRALDQRTRSEDAEHLRQWEEDLKKRENDLRKQEDTPPTDG